MGLFIKPDLNAVFNNAENYIANAKDEYMYMYSKGDVDIFRRQSGFTGPRPSIEIPAR
tara:strand:- start:361 stop:534 length:174 start_codon:yes stop_codon:yes gene_type:complete